MNKKVVGISIIIVSFMIMAVAVIMACFTTTVDYPLNVYVNGGLWQKVWITEEVKPFKTFSIPCSILGFLGVCVGIFFIFQSNSGDQKKTKEARPRKGKSFSKAKKAK